MPASLFLSDIWPLGSIIHLIMELDVWRASLNSTTFTKHPKKTNQTQCVLNVLFWLLREKRPGAPVKKKEGGGGRKMGSGPKNREHQPPNWWLPLGEKHQGVLYGCESWTINNWDRKNTEAFELRCWQRLLRVLWFLEASALTQSPVNQTEAFILDAFWEEPVHWKRPLCLEELKVEEDDQQEDGWRQSEESWTSLSEDPNRRQDILEKHCPHGRQTLESTWQQLILIKH